MSEIINPTDTAEFTVIAEFEVKPGSMEAFLAAAIEDASLSVANEPGCLSFDVSCGAENHDQVIFYEVYQSRQAFDAHLETPHLARFREVLPDLVTAELPVKFMHRRHPRQGV